MSGFGEMPVELGGCMFTKLSTIKFKQFLCLKSYHRNRLVFFPALTLVLFIL